MRLDCRLLWLNLIEKFPSPFEMTTRSHKHTHTNKTNLASAQFRHWQMYHFFSFRLQIELHQTQFAPTSTRNLDRRVILRTFPPANPYKCQRGRNERQTNGRNSHEPLRTSVRLGWLLTFIVCVVNQTFFFGLCAHLSLARHNSKNVCSKRSFSSVQAEVKEPKQK